MGPNDPNRRTQRRGWRAPSRGGIHSQSVGRDPQQVSNPAAPVDPYGGGGSQRPGGTGSNLTIDPGAGYGSLRAARARLPQARENVPPQSPARAVSSPFRPATREPLPSYFTPRQPSQFFSPNPRPPRPDTPAYVKKSPSPEFETPQAHIGKQRKAVPSSRGSPQKQRKLIRPNPAPMSQPTGSTPTPAVRAPARPAGQSPPSLDQAGAKHFVDERLTAESRRNVRKVLYYEELETIRRDEPLLPKDTPVVTLEVYRPSDAPTQGGKRVDPRTVGSSADKPVMIASDEDDDDDDFEKKFGGEGDPWEDPEYGDKKDKDRSYRYLKSSDHHFEWPCPSSGMRFNLDRFRRDFGWPTKDARELFEAEFAEGGKDFYADPFADQDAGLARDLVETGWQLNNDKKCDLIRGLPLVEDVVFVRHNNHCGKRGIAAGTCYWTAMATHLYGDARFWLRVKAEHLEHFAHVLTNRDHPRHQLYQKLNNHWYVAAASPGPGKEIAGSNRGPISVTLWQVLNLPGVYTPMAMLDVTADLYGLYLVVYSYHLDPEGNQDVGPYTNKVYKTIARGAYNARHLGLIFVNGNHFQPIIPNDFIHWEFIFPRFTQAATTGFPSAGKFDGIWHTWRSEYGKSYEGYGGQRAPAIVDHGFDQNVAAMAVGYPPPAKPEGEEEEGKKGGDDAPGPGGNGGGGGRRGESGGTGRGNGGTGDNGLDDEDSDSSSSWEQSSIATSGRTNASSSSSDSGTWRRWDEGIDWTKLSGFSGNIHFPRASDQRLPPPQINYEAFRGFLRPSSDDSDGSEGEGDESENEEEEEEEEKETESEVSSSDDGEWDESSTGSDSDSDGGSNRPLTSAPPQAPSTQKSQAPAPKSPAQKQSTTSDKGTQTTPRISQKALEKHSQNKDRLSEPDYEQHRAEVEGHDEQVRKEYEESQRSSPSTEAETAGLRDTTEGAMRQNLEEDLARARRQRDDLQHKLVDYDHRQQGLSQQNSSLQRKITTLVTEGDVKSQERAEQQRQMDEIQREKDEIQRERDEIQRERDQLRQDLAQLRQQPDPAPVQPDSEATDQDDDDGEGSNPSPKRQNKKSAASRAGNKPAGKNQNQKPASSTAKTTGGRGRKRKAPEPDEPEEETQSKRPKVAARNKTNAAISEKDVDSATPPASGSAVVEEGDDAAEEGETAVEEGEAVVDDGQEGSHDKARVQRPAPPPSPPSSPPSGVRRSVRIREKKKREEEESKKVKERSDTVKKETRVRERRGKLKKLAS